MPLGNGWTIESIHIGGPSEKRLIERLLSVVLHHCYVFRTYWHPLAVKLGRHSTVTAFDWCTLTDVFEREDIQS